MHVLLSTTLPDDTMDDLTLLAMAIRGWLDRRQSDTGPVLVGLHATALSRTQVGMLQELFGPQVLLTIGFER